MKILLLLSFVSLFFLNVSHANESVNAQLGTKHTSSLISDLTGNVIFRNLNPGVVLTVNRKITGNLFIEGNLNLGTSRLEVTGNIILRKGSINLSKGELLVGGNLIHSGGDLETSQGRLLINGDYRLQSISKICNYTYSRGRLIMDNEASYILVNGDVFIQNFWGKLPLVNVLTAGTLEVKGNFSQRFYDLGDFWYQRYSVERNFSATGTHKVILSGNKKQTVSFDNPSRSHFAGLELRNTSSQGIEFSTYVPVNEHFNQVSKNIVSSHHLVLGNNALNTLPADIIGDVTFSNLATNRVLSTDRKIRGDLIVNGKLNLGSSTLVVTGDLKLENGVLDLAKGKLFVNGRVIHSGGHLIVNEGRLEISKDYRLQSIDEEGLYSFSRGRLFMENELGYMLVKGDVAIQNIWDFFSYINVLTAGTMEIKGSFEQKFYDPGDYWYQGYSSERNFHSTGKHRVIFSGAAKQTISFDNPSRSQSRFAGLELRNTSSEGVEFLSYVPVNESYTQTSKKIVSAHHLVLGNNALNTMPSDLVGNTTFSNLATKRILSVDRKVVGDLTIKGKINLGVSTLEVTGDIKLENGVLDVDQGKLIVGGSIIHSGGHLAINDGQAFVSKDYRLQTLNDNGAFSFSRGRFFMEKESGYMLVNGDMVVQNIWDNPKYINILQAGTLEIKGNFSQKFFDPGDYWHQGYSSERNFHASNKHKVILSGNSKQTVSFDNPSLSQSRFAGFELRNTSAEGIEFLSYVPVNEFYKHNTKKLVSSRNLVLGNKALNTMSSDIIGDVTFNNLATNRVMTADRKIIGDLIIDGKISLGNSNLVVTGDVILKGGKLDLEQGKLLVGGRLIHSGGYLIMNEGHLKVTKDYLLQSIDKKGNFTFGRGRLLMEKPKAYLLINGDFVVQNIWDNPSFINILKAGIIELKGNFFQKNADVDDYWYQGYSSERNFHASGTLKVILSGSKPQTISFDSPLQSQSRFVDLELRNTQANGVTFLSKVSVMGELKHGQVSPNTKNSVYNKTGSSSYILNTAQNVATLGKVDTDGDGLPDLVEIRLGLDINNPNDAKGDLDGDGRSNLQEYLNGSNPTIAD